MSLTIVLAFSVRVSNCFLLPIAVSTPPPLRTSRRTQMPGRVTWCSGTHRVGRGEPVEPQPGLVRQPHRQARRRTDRDQRPDAGRDRLLDQLEPGPAADHQAGLGGGVAGQHPAPVTLSTALCRPTSSRTTSSSPAAVASAGARARRRCGRRPAGASRSRSGSGRTTSSGDRVRRTTGSARGTSSTASTLSLPHTPHADDPVDWRGVPVAGVAAGRLAEGDRDDVELLLGRQRRRRCSRRPRGSTPGPAVPSCTQPARRELEVVAGRPHRHPDPARRGAGPGEPDLQRLLGGQPVLVAAARRRR